MSERSQKTAMKAVLKSRLRERIGAVTMTASSMMLGGGVIVCVMYLVLALGSLILAAPAVAQSTTASAGARLQAGIEKEDVDGDLKSAMDIYAKIAADASAPRDVRAKALLRLAGCDEKLGHQARQIYEQIVHDYGDQAAAVQARKQLALLKQQEHPAPPTTMNVRKIDWKSVGLMGPGDTDGQRAVFMDQAHNLYFGDLAGHSKKLFFKAPAKAAFSWTTSKDMAQVSLQWAATATGPAILGVINTDGSGYHELIRDDGGDILGKQLKDGESDWLVHWFWNNKDMLVLTHDPKGGGNLLTVSAANGQRRVLLHVEAGWIQDAVPSPDGRYIAYEVVAPATAAGTLSHIFVAPTNGGEPRQVYESIARPDTAASALIPWTLRDWTADGHHLILADLKYGMSGLFLQPVKEGQAAGAAVFLRFGECIDGVTAATGSFVFQDQSTQTASLTPYVTSLDADGHPGKWRPLTIRGGMPNGANPWMSFSPDGKQIAYLAGDEDPDRRDLMLQDLSTGKERILYRSPVRGLLCQFSRVSEKVFCMSRADRTARKTDLFAVAVDTGQVEPLDSLDSPAVIYRSGPDDDTFFISKNPRSNSLGPMVRWDLKTHQGTQLMGPPAEHTVGGYKLTLDGKSVLHATPDSLSIRPVSSEDSRALVSGDDWKMLEIADTPDDKWVLFHSIDAAGKHGLSRVPLEGGPVERIGDFPAPPFGSSTGGGIVLSPDGRQALFVQIDQFHFDLWALDNFEPAAGK